MYLQKLSLVNFKNYEQAELDFSDKLNFFVGENGVGKTNILDSIYYLGLCKSYFNTIDSQNIKHGNDFFVIQGLFNNSENDFEIYCGVRKNTKKQFKKNKKEYSKMSEHIGLIPVVMISPSDINLIIGGSEERRKFINGVIAQHNRVYLDNLIRYNHILTQRNKLLKQLAKSNKFDEDSLVILDQQLIPLGKYIYQERKQFIENIIPVFQEYYAYISTGKEKVSFRYESQLNEMSFEQLLLKSRQKDTILQHTTTGIHRDDLSLGLDTHDMRKTGSQGQQKTYLVALKFAKFDYIFSTNNKKPIMLLDDVFDKFDNSRVKQIVHLVAGEKFGQIFITDTHQSRMEEIISEITGNFKLFQVEQGIIKENSINEKK